MNKDVLKKILVRRLQIWIHSYIYYVLNDSLVSDAVWSKWARELVSLQKEYPQESKEVTLYSIFKDFDGSTGFDLPFDIPWVKRNAEKLLNGTNDAIRFLKE